MNIKSSHAVRWFTGPYNSVPLNMKWCGFSGDFPLLCHSSQSYLALQSPLGTPSIKSRMNGEVSATRRRRAIEMVKGHISTWKARADSQDEPKTEAFEGERVWRVASDPST